LNYQFLSLVRALESYHRRKFSGRYISDDNFAPIREIFVNAIPKDLNADFRDSLKNKFKYLNEFSLKKRFDEILGRFESFVNTILGEDRSLISDITNTRNFLIHYDKSIETKAKKGQELYWLVQKMRFLLEVCFMSELGMSEELIRNLIMRNRRYNSLYLRKETTT